MSQDRLGLSELDAVIAVARRGSFRQAAIDLGVSTTALSNTIAQLEGQTVLVSASHRRPDDPPRRPALCRQAYRCHPRRGAHQPCSPAVTTGRGRRSDSQGSAQRWREMIAGK